MTQDTFSAGEITCNFDVLSEGRSRRQTALVSVRHIPGGNVNVVNRGGRELARRNLTLYVPSEGEMVNLEGCAGEQGTLLYDEGSYLATLVSVDSGEWYPGDQQLVRSQWLIEG